MGERLFDQITNATGLPPEMITNELNRIIEAAGLQKDMMTLEDLRRVLSEYAQDILVAAKDDLAQTPIKPGSSSSP